MSKTTNLILFMIIAFVFNMALIFIMLAVIVVIAGLIPGLRSNPVIFQIVLFLGFLASIVLAFFIYGWLMKKAVVRFNLEKHIPQLFKKRK
jgi:hypothetical protein